MILLQHDDPPANLFCFTYVDEHKVIHNFSYILEDVDTSKNYLDIFIKRLGKQ